MHISKEKRVRITLALLSIIDFAYTFQNFSQIKVILSSLLVLSNIVSMLLLKKKQLSSIMITLYYGKEIILFGPTSTWPVLYLFKKIGSQKLIFLSLFSIQIAFNYVDSLWKLTLKAKEHQCIELIVIFIYEGYSFYVEQKPFNQCIRLLIKHFKQDCILQLFDRNYNNIAFNQKNSLIVNRQAPSKNVLNSPKSDQIRLCTEEQELFYKLYLNNDDFQPLESNQQNSQNKMIFKSSKELLLFLKNNRQYYALAVLNEPYNNQKVLYQVKYLQKDTFYLLYYIKIEDGYTNWQNHKISKYKQNLINIFNHKLKTPLNGAIGHLITANEDENIMEKVKQSYLQPALLNCRLQLYLVQDILDYLSCEVEQLTIMSNKTNLQSLLSELYDLIENQCKIKKIDIFDKLDSKYWFIYTDSNKLIRVLLNILNTSYRYTDEGGCISLEIKLDQLNKITYFTIIENGSGINEEQIQQLTEQLKQLDQCATTNKSNKLLCADNRINSGINLYLVNKLIKLLSGDNSRLQLRIQQNNQLLFTFSISDTLDLQSESSLGRSKNNSLNKQKSLRSLNKISFQQSPRISKFKQLSQRQFNFKSYNSFASLQQTETIDVEPIAQIPSILQIKDNKHKYCHQRQKLKSLKKPIDYQQCQKTSSKIHSADSAIQQLQKTEKYVLVVDDEPFNHETLCLMLKNIGFNKFLKAFNGQQCIDLVLQYHEQIYMIMMDIDMPVMNGIETTTQLEELIVTNSVTYIPIIGCTAHEDYESHLKCFEAGMIHVVIKPVFIKSLQEALYKISELNSNETIKENNSPYIMQRVKSQTSDFQ
ncbi:unnamed protein product (macronuclear) [Paramecium tetraurelia]|uniref:Response regulatory domain-containing protein n=1 Tax=Paramecium tetraurelia TaxID=5888 RepID=A0DBV3_PARTE|nr:uncharacterized protein GSPATT00015397001 [Paramecium tetraurelia]CAK80520.1 unnamed protein product [Paramecium tetraurelia]|eukprot:XP_001447917.1 hypothetical protein (macronuclear) [Paramecium tetraurelia strain d4-2]